MKAKKVKIGIRSADDVLKGEYSRVRLEYVNLVYLPTLFIYSSLTLNCPP